MFGVLEFNRSINISRNRPYIGVSKYLRSTGLKPPSKSALSVFWFMLNTWSFLPRILATSWTTVVFPVPVSPTKSNGSST